MTTIDHSAYPHLVEAVLSHATLDVLLAFRATSHHFHDAVDAQSARHMVCGQTLTSMNGVLVVPLRTPVSKRLLATLQHTRILDVHLSNSSHEGRNFFAYLTTILPALDIVRVYSYMETALPPAHTVLCMAHVHILSSARHRRLVFHSNEISTVEAAYGNAPIKVSEIVVICPSKGLGPILTSHLAADLAELLRASHALQVDRITVIDLGDDERARRLLGLVRHVAAGQEGQEGVARIDCFDWTFVSRDEYACTLSDEERELTLPVGDRDFPILKRTGYITS